MKILSETFTFTGESGNYSFRRVLMVPVKGDDGQEMMFSYSTELTLFHLHPSDSIRSCNNMCM